MAVPEQPKSLYIDRPNLIETFVDTIRHVTFDGSTVRAELGVTRLEEASAKTPASAKQYPACRLVLRPDAAVDLFMRLQRLVALMEQRGIIKREQPRQQLQSKPADALENPLGEAAKGTDQKH